MSRLLILLVGVSAFAADIKPVAVARTELKVSRSLDPSTMQTVNVMTKDGSVAQLIVKRRDGKSQTTTTAPPTSKPTIQLKLIQDTIQSNWMPVSALLNPSAGSMDSLIIAESKIANTVTNEEKNTKTDIPKAVTIRSGNVFVKNAPDEFKRGRSILELGTDGIPVIHGVRVPDDESDTKVWRNARVINGELVPYEKGHLPQAAIPVGQLIFATKAKESTNEYNGFGPFTTSDNFALNGRIPSSIGPFTVDDNKSYLGSEDTMHKINKNNHFRYSSESGIGPFTKADNAKIINSKLIDYIKHINEQESKREYFASRKYKPESKYSNPNQQIQRRMLQHEGVPNYPNSMLYTPGSTKLNNVNFNDGVRTPVLQYAHPELGVQPANMHSDEEAKFEVERNSLQTQYSNTDSQVYVPDGGTFNEFSDIGRNNRNKIFEKDNYYRKNDDMRYHTYNPTYYNRYRPEPPFWMKVTESLKDNLQHGIARMQQFTRPVLDPIVEATQKIGHNLGLTPLPSGPSEAQEKIGFAPPIIGTSVILPALGLVAGGAALGLGAAAVGRFLDVGNRRSQNQNLYLDHLQFQHQRSLDSFGDNSNEFVFVVESQGNTEDNQYKNVVNAPAANARRRRRAIPSVRNEKYLEELLQSVEHDIGRTDIGAHLVGSPKWADTPCAKKIFCNVMITQPYEEIAFMEKKIDSFLLLVHPVLVNSVVSSHLSEVMQAIKLQDCSQFLCQIQEKTKKVK